MNRAMVVLVGLIVLAGCSGDGGDSTPPAAQAPIEPLDPNLTVPVDTALSNIVTKGLNQSFTISGFVDNSTQANPVPPTPITGNGQLTLGAGVPWVSCGFQSIQAAQVVTGTTFANGVSTPLATTSTIDYRGDNTVVATNDGREFLLFLPVTFPVTVRAGDAWPTGAGTQVDSDCTTRLFPATSTGAYSVASDSAKSLLVTFVKNITRFGGSLSQSTTVYRIDTSGNVSLVSVTTTESLNGSVFQTVIFTFR